MKYKVGDKVIVKPDLKAESMGKENGYLIAITGEMVSLYAGRLCKITDIDEDNCSYEINDDVNWNWPASAFIEFIDPDNSKKTRKKKASSEDTENSVNELIKKFADISSANNKSIEEIVSNFSNNIKFPELFILNISIY